jgi:hypothetical protein
MVGLPGETEGTRIDNALLCRELKLDMIGLGPFIPHPETPLKNSAKQSIDLTLKSTSLVRLLLPEANIPATTAIGTIDPAGKEKALVAGANVIMVNITPKEFKKDYLLYPDKICLDEDGRFILPQVETIRDCLDKDCASLVVKERELKYFYGALKIKPKLVVTDSQAFSKVAADIPAGQMLTSFSILFARKKGDLAFFVKGVSALKETPEDAKVLVLESCSHHR